MKQWISQQGADFYVMAVAVFIGLIMTAAANRTYKRLIREAGNVEDSSNRLIKYIKLKYSSYYKIGLKPNNMKAMVNKYFQQYKIGPVSLELWSKTGIAAAGVCGITAMVYMLAGFYGGKRTSDMYILITEAVLSVFILGMQYIFYGFGRKQNMFCQTMYDYLENFLKNKIENGDAVRRMNENDSESADSEVRRHDRQDSEKYKSGRYRDDEYDREYDSYHQVKDDRERKGSSQAAATAIDSGRKSGARDAQRRYSSEDDEIDARIVEDILKEFLI